MTDMIKSLIKDGILTLQMNRPDKKNALTMNMYADMAKAITDAGNNPDISVIMITGKDDSFCAGNDLKDFRDNPPDSEDSPVYKFMTAISECELPIVAAVNGTAVGIGVTMLLHCDFVYVEENAVMSLPFINLGLVPEAGSSMLLTNMSGYQRAAELLMLGEPFTPKDAKDMGFVNKICKADELLDIATKTANKLVEKPRDALMQTKALMRRDSEPMSKRLSEEAEVFKKCLKSAETKEAIDAFVERRKADFSKINKNKH